ncbi:hypothetical protein [Dyella acidiphila]|uniref:Uncharacterized protein n=1 Tax=Dyella acidiphila TaxID=2775866 RepID=A0ABR9GFG3_9GAMM|nr:hypothetical protein [Dyella acidiphila]MBE1162797.1 hypothetical protein [Dyella acidiphila]
MRKPFKIMLGIIVTFMCFGAVLSFNQGKSSTGNDSSTAQSRSESMSDSTASVEASFPADEKEFSHRYNSIADQAWKITDIQPNQGFDTLQMPDGSYIEAKDSEYLFFPSGSISRPSIIAICTWMVRAASPSTPASDAEGAATKAATNPSSTHNLKIIVGNVVVIGSTYPAPCAVSSTGL